MTYTLKSIGKTITEVEQYEVTMPDGSKETFSLKADSNTEAIANRAARNQFSEWRLKQAQEFEETHYGVSIKRYLNGKVIKEGWARNVHDARQQVLESIAHSCACDVSHLSGYEIEYFGFFPRIYISGFGDEDYYQFERGEFKADGYEPGRE